VVQKRERGRWKRFKIIRHPWVDETLVELRKAESQNLVDAIKVWKDCFMRFYGVYKIRLDAVDIKCLKSMLSFLDFDMSKFESLCCAFFHEHKFKRYFRERNLVPTIPRLLKYRNEFMSNLRFVEARLEMFRRFRRFFDFLGLQPLVTIKDGVIPFGLDLPEDLRREGYRFCDVIEIDRRKMKIFRSDGENVTVFGYAHFGQVFDEITKKVRSVDTDEVMLLRIEDITDFEMQFWFDKRWSMVDKKKEYLEWLKRRG
jgi:hypothetical protein